MIVLAIYFQRLTVYKLPAREVIVSVFLPLGPLGQGGFALMQLGKVALATFPKTKTLDAAGVDGSAGAVLYVVGLLLALIMWGFGLVCKDSEYQFSFSSIVCTLILTLPYIIYRGKSC